MDNKKIVKQAFRIICIVQTFVASALVFLVSNNRNICLNDKYCLDKILHLIAFCIYGLSLQTSIFAIFYKTQNVRKNIIMLLVLIIGVLFAASDEVHQIFVPNREGSIADLIIDVAGIAISLAMYKKYVVILRKFLP